MNLKLLTFQIYDATYVGVEGKFAHSIIHSRQFNGSPVSGGTDSQIFKKWREQSDFQFGFVPLGGQKMPQDLTINTVEANSLIEIHDKVKQTGKLNFLGACIPVTSQLNVEVWEDL